MCGIVGIIDKTANIDEEALRCATHTLRRRGPDDSGTWVENNVGFGHQRLAILDVSIAAHQPMHSADGRYVIVYNGEVYNFHELRKQLADGVNEWQTHSDTEVILAAYAKWGVECVSHFHGMFAFSIWDRRDKVLFSARDRMGVKPFYYHYSANRFMFASRPKALWQLDPECAFQVDEQALRYYLESGYVPAPYSIHEQIRKLPPAHYLLYSERGITIKRYWDFRTIPAVVEWEQRSEEDLLDELDDIATRSVSSRMISDVPLGAFLSGGIDSSLVVALMARLSTQPVKTFTIGFNDKVYDESAHAQAVARYLGTDHYCEQLNVDDLLELMPAFIEEYDEPFFDSSAFPTMAVSRLARHHVTVSVSGDGGDELFGGYHYYDIMRRLERLYSWPGLVRKGLAGLAGVVPVHQLRLLSGALSQDDLAGAFSFIRSIAKDYPSVLSPETLEKTKSLRQLFADESAFHLTGLCASDQGMRLDASFTLPDDYLQKMDLASMAFSLEAREPLLDHELVEWGMKLPLEWKLRDGKNKYLLRKLACRYLPEAILDRPKGGFVIPLAEWLRGPLREYARERLNDQAVYSRLPIDQETVLKLFELHDSGRRNVHPLLWAILVLFEFAAENRSAGLH